MDEPRIDSSGNDTLLVPHRFCGPPESGNGGWTAGAVARHLGGELGTAYTITLRKPPPLEAEMDLVQQDGTLTVRYDDQVIAEGTVAQDGGTAQVPEFVAYVDAEAATERFPGRTFHPFPTCFTCGIDRPDGLRIFPGQVERGPEGTNRVAATWTPNETITDDRRHASLEATWAALDCTGGWAGGLGERLMVLGRTTATIRQLPEIGVPLIVVGEELGTEGRKTRASTAIYTPRQELIGYAEQVWISVNPRDFGAAEI